MYDIKSIEYGQQQQKIENNNKNNNNNSNNNFIFFDHHFPLKTSSTIAKTIEPLSSQRDIAKISCSVISSSDISSLTSLESSISSCTSLSSVTSSSSISEFSQMTLMSLRRRRILQRQACLLSIIIAFIFGLSLGVFMPMIGFTNVFSITSNELTSELSEMSITMKSITNRSHLDLIQYSSNNNNLPHPPSDFPTIYNKNNNNNINDNKDDIGQIQQQPFEENLFSVSFIKEKLLPSEEVFRNAFHLEQDKTSEDSMIVKKFDSNDGSIKEFRVQRTSDGRFRKGPEKRLSHPSVVAQVLNDPNISEDFPVNFIPIAQKIIQNARDSDNQEIIKNDIYWGDLIEKTLPKGFTSYDSKKWNDYVKTAVVKHLEIGCGRMQNRLVIFSDGTKACARYRQNTDQIQGELFSFYLGQILNLTNLAPSAASIIDLDSINWSPAIQDITNAQWKSSRPVVLTRWLPDLEPAGIPTPFQPLERHLNKYDVWNITLGADFITKNFKTTQTNAIVVNTDVKNSDTISFLPSVSTSNKNHKGLLKRLGAAISIDEVHQSSPSTITTTIDATTSHSDISDVSSILSKQIKSLNSTIIQRLIELAQWSDLIVFDYLIANLDRVVNNLYNYQWNADIMAAPAHNLARQTKSQLLVFLDNESGLLHGYRLLKKYEAYHGLLLDNLCVFRQPTIQALQKLREYGPGQRLHDIFEQTTSQQIRDVLPSLPDKSIKILIDRIDRVLGQVQKCRDLFSDR